MPGDRPPGMASTYNAMIEAARDAKKVANMQSENSGMRPAQVFVKPNADIGICEPVMLVEAQYDGQFNMGDFQKPPVLPCVKIQPRHAGKFTAVAVQPIKQGSIGRAVARGLVQVMVRVLAAEHRYVVAKTNTVHVGGKETVTHYDSSEHGFARIVWRPHQTIDFGYTGSEDPLMCLIDVGDSLAPPEVQPGFIRIYRDTLTAGLKRGHWCWAVDDVFFEDTWYHAFKAALSVENPGIGLMCVLAEDLPDPYGVMAGGSIPSGIAMNDRADWCLASISAPVYIHSGPETTCVPSTLAVDSGGDGGICTGIDSEGFNELLIKGAGATGWDNTLEGHKARNVWAYLGWNIYKRLDTDLLVGFKERLTLEGRVVSADEQDGGGGGGIPPPTDPNTPVAIYDLNDYQRQKSHRPNLAEVNEDRDMSGVAAVRYPIVGNQGTNNGKTTNFGIERRLAIGEATTNTTPPVDALILKGLETLDDQQLAGLLNSTTRQRVYGMATGGQGGWGLYELEDLFKFDANNKRFYIDLAGYSNFKTLADNAHTWDFNSDANLGGQNGATFDVLVDVWWDEQNKKLMKKKRTVTIFKFGLKSVSQASEVDTEIETGGHFDLRYDTGSRQLQKQTAQGGNWSMISGGQFVQETV